MFKKILCPIDFSPGSQLALQRAAWLAKGSNAELVLAHACYVPPFIYAEEYPMPIDTVARMTEDAKRSLAESHAEAIRLGAPNVSTRFLEGIPWDNIVRVAADPTFDLIVIGTQGRTGFKRLLLGSVAEKVVRHASCSVLVARGEATAFEHVLCATDFSTEARIAMTQAAALATGSITLFHAIELPVSYSGEPSVPGFLDDVDKRSAELLTTWTGELAAKTKATVSHRARIGSPAQQALAILDDRTYDLAVVGSHGRTGIRRILLGSVAENIVRHAPCSVLVSRSR